MEWGGRAGDLVIITEGLRVELACISIVTALIVSLSAMCSGDSFTLAPSCALGLSRPHYHSPLGNRLQVAFSVRPQKQSLKEIDF